MSAIYSYSPNGNYLAIGDRQNQIHVYRRMFQPLSPYAIEQGETAREESGWQKWLTNTLHQRGIYNQSGEICAISWHDDALICSESSAGSLILWRVQDGAHLATTYVARNARA